MSGLYLQGNITEREAMTEQPSYISFSQFTTYLSCSEKYRLSRILKLEEDPAWYFAGGSAVHAAADAIDHALLAEQVVPF